MIHSWQNAPCRRQRAGVSVFTGSGPLCGVHCLYDLIMPDYLGKHGQSSSRPFPNSHIKYWYVPKNIKQLLKKWYTQREAMRV